MKIDALKEKVEALEKTLLAIDELSNLCQEAICHGNKPIDLEHCANILHYLGLRASYSSGCDGFSALYGPATC